MYLDKIDPQFRLLTDQLFFTDRMDLDLSGYSLFLNKESEHYKYLWDRVYRSMEISWPESFWLNRFEFLFNLSSKNKKDEIENYLYSQFYQFVTHNDNTISQFNNEYIRFIAWIKMKLNKKENVNSFREFLLGLSHSLHSSKLPLIINNFIPFLFTNMGDYIKCLSKRIGQSTATFEVIQQLEKQGIAVDKQFIYKLTKDLLFKKVPSRQNRRSFFAMLADVSVMTYLKSEYKLEYRDKLINLIKNCDFREIEEYHLRNIKNLLELDPSIVDELLTIYADKLYVRGSGDKESNIRRLIRVCKTYPQFSPKKVLVYLSDNNRIIDVKKLVEAFHDLKTLVPFI